MALLTSMGKIGLEVLADASHKRNRTFTAELKNYRGQVQEVLSGLNLESPKHGSWERGINVIHYRIQDDFAYLILCEKSSNETEAFNRLEDLIQFNTSFYQHIIGPNVTGIRKNVQKNNAYQLMFDDFYSKESGKVIKTPQFVSSEVDSESDSEVSEESSRKKSCVQRVHFDEPTYKFLCSECGYGTMVKSNLVRHSKSNCAERLKKPTLKCPENDCDWLSPTLADLETHMSSLHGREFEIETKELENESELEEFLTKIERNFHSTYVRRQVQKSTKSFILHCSRSHQFKHKSKGTGKRKLKTSNKCDKVCTSRIRVELLERGRLKAIFHKTHSGHSIEITRLYIPMPDKIRIAEMLKEGSTKQEVIEKIRAENCGKMNRLSLITCKDVTNIIAQFKLGRVKYSADGVRRPKKQTVQLGFEGNSDEYFEEQPIQDNVIEIEQEFEQEEVLPENRTIPPSESTTMANSSDMAEIRTLFSTVYSRVQSQTDAQVVKNALETAMALMCGTCDGDSHGPDGLLNSCLELKSSNYNASENLYSK